MMPHGLFPMVFSLVVEISARDNGNISQGWMQYFRKQGSIWTVLGEKYVDFFSQIST